VPARWDTTDLKETIDSGRSNITGVDAHWPASANSSLPMAIRSLSIVPRLNFSIQLKCHSIRGAYPIRGAFLCRRGHGTTYGNRNLLGMDEN
jgi:hypothetical protein